MMENEIYNDSAPQRDVEQNMFRSLRRFARQGYILSTPGEAPSEHCDLCAAVLPTEHRHLLDLQNQNIICACQACALLFERQNHPKYRLIPARYLALPQFAMSELQWDALLIPVNMAFFFFSSPEGRVRAFYPGPAGATESLLSMEHWNELLSCNSALRLLLPDVEALLVNRLEQTQTYTLVPLDCCYRLVGIIKTSWRGLSGGAEVWQAIETFFADLQKRARAMDEEEKRLATDLAPGQGGLYA